LGPGFSKKAPGDDSAAMTGCRVPWDGGGGFGGFVLKKTAPKI
jgi:hypothetical protein